MQSTADRLFIPPLLSWGIRLVGSTPFSPAAIKRAVFLSIDAQEGALMIQSRFCEIIFNWEHSMVAIYIKTCIFKTISLHVADAICSTVGG